MKIINKNLDNGNDTLFFKLWRNIVIRRRISKYLKLSFCQLFLDLSSKYENGLCSMKHPTILDYMFFIRQDRYFLKIINNGNIRIDYNLNNINRNSNIKFLDYTQYTKDRKLSANDSFKQLKQINNLRNKNSKNDIKNKLSKRNNKNY
ncbi:hypothetical protein ACTFIV_009945 [Dictyostelium citrinum]